MAMNETTEIRRNSCTNVYDLSIHEMFFMYEHTRYAFLMAIQATDDYLTSGDEDYTTVSNKNFGIAMDMVPSFMNISNENIKRYIEVLLYVYNEYLSSGVDIAYELSMDMDDAVDDIFGNYGNDTIYTIVGQTLNVNGNIVPILNDDYIRRGIINDMRTVTDRVRRHVDYNGIDPDTYAVLFCGWRSELPNDLNALFTIIRV